jgi:hypothetical protein
MMNGKMADAVSRRFLQGEKCFDAGISLEYKRVV